VTAPKRFEIDNLINSDDPIEAQQTLVRAARKGCFIEPTLGQSNRIIHKSKTPNGWLAVD